MSKSKSKSKSKDNFDEIIKEFKTEYPNQKLFKQELKKNFPTHKIINITNSIKYYNDLALISQMCDNKNTIRFAMYNGYNFKVLNQDTTDIILVVLIDDNVHKFNFINGVIINIRKVIEGFECCICFESDIQYYLNCSTCRATVCKTCNDDIISSQMANNTLCCLKCKKTLRCPICTGINFIESS
jgi:hypothetical protein